MTQRLAPCPFCNKPPSVEQDGLFWFVTCVDCYDGAPDGNRTPATQGTSRDRAVGTWNDMAEAEVA